MPTAVFLKLRNGRQVRFGVTHDTAGAEKVRSDLEQWIRAGTTLTIANAQGGAEDILSAAIAEVALVHEATPQQGSRHLE